MKEQNISRLRSVQLQQTCFAAFDKSSRYGLPSHVGAHFHMRTLFIFVVLLPCAGLNGETVSAEEELAAAQGRADRLIGQSGEGFSSSGRLLSQKEVLSMALGSSFTMREERFGADIAQEGVRSAQGLFDPTLEVSHHYDHGSGRTTIFSPLDPDLERTFTESAIGVRGLVPGGGEYGLFLDSSKSTTEVSGPDVDTTASISIVQPLLRGFRRGAEWSAIRLAHNRAFQSAEDYREAVMYVTSDVLMAYNDLLYAQRNLEVVRRNEGLARRLLRDNESRVNRGAMAPMDVLQAESAVALRQGFVLEAEQVLRETNSYLLSLIYKDVGPYLNTRIEILDTEVSEHEQLDALNVLDRALALRPDYQRALLNTDMRDIELERAQNQTRPRLDLVGSYGLRGIGETRRDSFNDLEDDGKSFYSAGVLFNLPIPGRAAQSEWIAASLQKRRSEVALEKHRQQILLILDTAIHRMNTHWQRLNLAREATLLARKALHAEEEKLSVGMSNSFVVLRLQEDLGDAERREALTERNYMNALIYFQRESGEILDHYQISLPE